MTREGLSLIAGIVPVDSLNTMPSESEENEICKREDLKA